MSKLCFKCGTVNDDNSNFCKFCGTREFIKNNNTPIQPPLNTFEQPPQQVKTEQSGTQPWMIFLIVILGIMLFAVLIFAVVNSYDPVEQEDTIGLVEGDYYINSWAGFSFEITDEWPESDSSEYYRYSDENTSIGFLSTDDEGEQFIVATVDLSSIKNKSQYNIDEYMDFITETATDEFDKMDLNYYVYDYYDYYIAGEKYRTAQIDLEYTMSVRYFVRQIDDYMVYICASSSDFSKITRFTDSIVAID